MLQYRTLNRLSNLIQAVAEGEQKTEVIRQVLAEQRHFEPQSAFRRLDQTKTGQLSATDLIDFLEQNKILISHKEAIQLLRILDLNNDGRVTYADFAESILPQEDARLKQIANLREGYYLEDGESLPYEAEWSLARVLEQEVKNYRNIESLKDILCSSYDFNKLDLFNAIDDLRTGSLTISAVDEFMRSQGKVLSQDQLLAFFRRISNTNVISYPQFVEIITPVEPSPSYIANSSRLGSSSRGFKQSSLNRSIYNTPSRLNSSKAFQDAEKDLGYQDYLARSASLEKLRNSHYSPARRSNYGSPVRYTTQQRSPYHTPSKDLALTQSMYGSASKGFNQTATSNLNISKSPMRGNEEEHLVRALKEQIVLDRDVEELKNQLSFRHDFNAEDAFRIFDKKARGYISKFEFELSLNDIGIYPTKDELHLFYKRYDRDNDGLLKFSDFSELVTPASLEYAALSKSRVPNYLNPDDGLINFSLETRRLYKKLLNKIFQAEIEAEYIRQKLSRRPLFSLYDAFLSIDNLENGFITLNDFKAILQDYGIFVSTNDLQTLVKRYDKNQDNRVTFPEFMNELTPKSPVKQF
ncbi:hypothetical protein ABPG72_017348 [Tetrahymena utriculariae]